MKNHYKTLGLEHGASQAEIQTAYDKLSKELNPANNDNQEFFVEEYQKVQEAYKALYNTSILATEKGLVSKISKSNKSQKVKPLSKPKSKTNSSGNLKKVFAVFAGIVIIAVAGYFIFQLKLNLEVYQTNELAFSNNKIYLKYNMSLLNGEVKDSLMAGYVKDGKEEGNWRYWYKSGQLKQEGSFINGIKEGNWSYWHERGQLAQESNYVNGKTEGLYRTWYESGQPKEEGNYVNGEREGINRWWHDNGELKKEWNYMNGEPPAAIGDFRNGGVVFYVAPIPTDLDDDGDLDTGLVCAIKDQTTKKGIQWRNGRNLSIGADESGVGSGAFNTKNIIKVQGAVETNYAAGLARAYTGGGYSDWFLPSKDELNLMYKNKKAINYTATANGGSLITVYYTSKSSYTFKYYWSSTEHRNNSNEFAWAQHFSDGNQVGYPKKGRVYVRAVRAF